MAAKREKERLEREEQERAVKSQEVVNPYLLMQLEENKKKEELEQQKKLALVKEMSSATDGDAEVFNRDDCVETKLI